MLSAEAARQLEIKNPYALFNEANQKASETFLLEASDDIKKAIECGKKKIHLSIPHCKFGLGNYNDDQVADLVFKELASLGYSVKRGEYSATSADVTWKVPAPAKPEKAALKQKRKWYCMFLPL